MGERPLVDRRRSVELNVRFGSKVDVALASVDCAGRFEEIGAQHDCHRAEEERAVVVLRLNELEKCWATFALASPAYVPE